jgi:hypothetical protein
LDRTVNLITYQRILRATHNRRSDSPMKVLAPHQAFMSTIEPHGYVRFKINEVAPVSVPERVLSGAPETLHQASQVHPVSIAF